MAPTRESTWLQRSATAAGTAPFSASATPPGTRISKPHLDSFIAASAREPFTARIVVDTGDEWGTTARKAIAHLKPSCFVLRFGDLASRPFDWPDLGRDEPENPSYQHEPYSLRPHQQAAFDDVTRGFQTDDRGKLVMACGTGKTFVALRSGRRHRRPGAVPRPVDRAVRTVDAGVGDPADGTTPLHRDLFRHKRREKRRGSRDVVIGDRDRLKRR